MEAVRLDRTAIETNYAAAAHEPLPAMSIADAARRCRWIAADLHATGSSLFFVSPSADRARLVPCFDSEYPQISASTKLLSGQGGDELSRHARISTIPCWWSNDDTSRSATTLGTLVWASRISLPAPHWSGIAFPVYAERGQCGLIVFVGHDIVLAQNQLAEFHARCFAVFSAVARLCADDSGRIPSISKRELECLKLTANGLTSEEIASRLNLSVHTANQYLTNTTQKLNAVNRMHAVAKGLRLGLIE
ncbi:helix-turn-helix transcriptional regulator [Pseudaminobacter salicylatoxidans]|uniref:helix-turn-helix transcriptional regulator n=1 Tax=Pseudaminobacter salicylatoxidans TaxID=93369 RepID=UPI00036F2F81|nr:helix-turn-helix transcriptional regulator [Pseudaminobacter salicylatoxidans]